MQHLKCKATTDQMKIFHTKSVSKNCLNPVGLSSNNMNKVADFKFVLKICINIKAMHM